MLDRGAAVVVRDSSEMTDFVRRCLEVPRYAASLGERAARLVRDNLGATDRTLELLDQLLPKSDSSDNRAAA
jgi:3-deoxy-D-manno-octulosonic-acid transferase